MKKKYIVEGMSCATCSSHVDKAVSKVVGVKKCSVNLVSKVLLVDGAFLDSDIVQAVTKLGFEISSNDSIKPIVLQKKSLSEMAKRLIVSAAFLVPLMYISMGHMFSFWIPSFLHGVQNSVLFALLQMLLTLPVLYVNRVFFISGYKKLFRLKPNMDSLIAIGSSAAFIYGVICLFFIGYGVGNGNFIMAEKYSMQLYFESSAMILTLITLGKFLEDRAKNRTFDSIRKLMDLAPKMTKVKRNENVIEIKSSEVVLGDIVVLQAGDSIATDGRIISGNGTFDESAITGESIPVYKETSDSIISGSILLDGYVLYEATKVGEQTTINQIVKLVEEASSSKAPISKLADKISGIFVPVVIGICIVTLVVWLALGYEFSLALSFAISVLVVSCPCALGLATPLAIMVGTGKGAEHSILIKSAESLEILSKATVIVLDKTGTITQGKPAVKSVVLHSSINEKDTFDILMSLEKASNHPISHAIMKYGKDIGAQDTSPKDFTNHIGKGIEGVVNSKKYYVGNRKFMSELGIETQFSSDGIEVFLSDGKSILATVVCEDSLKQGSVEAIHQLQKLGKRVVMLTGDNEKQARKIASQIGDIEVVANVLPHEKEQYIIDLQNKGETVIMCGDGINDSVALTRSDVAIGLSNGSDIAMDCADIVLTNSNLSSIVSAITLSKKVVRNIKQNLFWAFIYNTLAIPVACGVFFVPFAFSLSPMLAALLMSVSSLFVVLNALRLKFFYSMK